MSSPSEHNNSGNHQQLRSYNVMDADTGEIVDPNVVQLANPAALSSTIQRMGPLIYDLLCKRKSSYNDINVNADNQYNTPVLALRRIVWWITKTILVNKKKIYRNDLEDKVQTICRFNYTNPSELENVVAAQIFHSCSLNIDSFNIIWNDACDAIMQLWSMNKFENNAADVAEPVSFAFTGTGLRILRKRYLHTGEDLRAFFDRLAKMFSYPTFAGIGTDSLDSELIAAAQCLVSQGCILPSSVLADAHQSDDPYLRGDACCLMVGTKTYDREFIRQLEVIIRTASIGVGVGVNLSHVPNDSTMRFGEIRTGMPEILQRLDSSMLVHIYERKPRVAVYIHVHCDSLYTILHARHPQNPNRCHSVFSGLLVSNYFMECVRHNKPWYLFSGRPELEDGRCLHEVHGDEYIEVYEKLVASKKYVSFLPSARTIMQMICRALTETGSPYIIFIDQVQAYNNQKFLGPIQTLNLCAEITEFASQTNVATCTLLSVNAAGALSDGWLNKTEPNCRRFISALVPELWQQLEEQYWSHGQQKSILCNLNESELLQKYSFISGFMSVWCLNNHLVRVKGSSNDLRRELGISFMGVFDLALVLGRNLRDVAAEMSEWLYLGAIAASCAYSKRYSIQCVNYAGSEFSKGRFQFDLRGIEPQINASIWSWMRQQVQKDGMANSMLTAQAPTATTSMLQSLTESLTIPMNTVTVYETESGRSTQMQFGTMTRLLGSDCNQEIRYPVDIKTQLSMFSATAPFCDQSQATQFVLDDWSQQGVFNLIRATYEAKLKTGIYYVLARKHLPTLGTTATSTFKCERQNINNNDSVLTIANTHNNGPFLQSSSSRQCNADIVGCESCSL